MNTLQKYTSRLILFPLGILWMELVFKWWTLGTPLGRGPVYTALFSLAIGLLIACLSSLGSSKVNKIVSAVLMGVVTLWFWINAVYHTIFKTFLALDSVTMAGDAIGSYWRETLAGIANTLPALLLLAIPMILLMVYILSPKGRHAAEVLAPCVAKAKLLFLCAAILTQGLAIFTVNIASGGVMSDRKSVV